MLTVRRAPSNKQIGFFVAAAIMLFFLLTAVKKPRFDLGNNLKVIINICYTCLEKFYFILFQRVDNHHIRRNSISALVDEAFILNSAELRESVENALNLGHWDRSAKYKILPNFVLADGFKKLAKVSMTMSYF